MAGIEFRHSSALLDEIPLAYKDIDEVIENAKALVEVRYILRHSSTSRAIDSSSEPEEIAVEVGDFSSPHARRSSSVASCRIFRASGYRPAFGRAGFRRGPSTAAASSSPSPRFSSG
jgi:tRNA-splicing ligase RtcB